MKEIQLSLKLLEWQRTGARLEYGSIFLNLQIFDKYDADEVYKFFP